MSFNFFNLKKRRLNFFYLLGLFAGLLVVFQNCAPESESTGLFSGDDCPECQGTENIKELSLSINSNGNMTLGLPDAAAGVSDNFSISGTCNTGGFSRTTIRWQLRDMNDSLKYFGTTLCTQSEPSDGFSIHKHIPRAPTGLTEGNYHLNIQIYGITRTNEEVSGPSSTQELIVEAKNTIPPPKLFTIQASGSTHGTPNLWNSRLRIIKTSTQTSTVTFLTGLCHYVAGQNNNIRVSLSKVKVEPIIDTLNNISKDTTCKSLPEPIEGYPAYTGYFYLDPNQRTPLDFNSGSLDYENCSLPGGNPNAAVCRAGYSSLNNRFFDVKVSQVDPISSNFIVTDKKVLAIIFTHNTGLALNGSDWNYDIFLETLKRLKLSFLLTESVVNNSDQELTDIDLNIAYRIFQTNNFIDNVDEDSEPGFPLRILQEEFSTRRWVLAQHGLDERRAILTASPLTLGALKVTNIGALANIIYKTDGENLADGSECGIVVRNPVQQHITGIPNVNTTVASLNAQRIALCLVAKFYLGIVGNYKNPDGLTALAGAVSNGVTYTAANSCKVTNTNTDLAVVTSDFCLNLTAYYNQVKDFMNIFMPGLNFDTASDDQRNNATAAIAQFYVNQLMYAISSNNYLIENITKKVLIDSGLEDLLLPTNATNLQSVLASLKPREINFEIPPISPATSPTPGVPFAAYTSYNTPGSTAGAVGSYTTAP